MSKRPATPEERSQCVELYNKLTDNLHGAEFDVILNTLCFVLGEVGYDLHDSLTKQRFIAQVVEQVSSAYDTCLLGRSKHEGEA